ncbi:hypothetical protein [Photobacterium profundum]|uniref:Uncharacterized protein n=1 Tax=Photobacterium profundum (strain SS9) TaxID=298386 RepID=Q6LFW0_PHOPR|nr:hypothetical protein [Photobacterium profundum]CAG23820.1 hypothetical protein PBPRB1975 [Photobacterium profundum SS9]
MSKPKSTMVTSSYIAMEIRTDIRNISTIPSSITIPANRHRIYPYNTESDTSMKAGRDITFNVDATKYPLVFKAYRTPETDITIKYNKSRDKSKGTIVKISKFKIDMMIGGWWKGNIKVTPTCSGDKGLCDSITKLDFQSVATQWSSIYHSTTMNNPVEMKNQAPSVQVNNQPWNVKLHFSNLDKLTGIGKRSSA